MFSRRGGQSPILYPTTSSKVSTSCRLFGILALTNTMERHPKSVKRDILYAYVNPICCRGPGDQINERRGGESAPPCVTQATQKLYATCQKWHLIWLPILLISSPVKKSKTYQSGYFLVERLLATNNDVLTQNVVHTLPESYLRTVKKWVSLSRVFTDIEITFR